MVKPIKLFRTLSLGLLSTLASLLPAVAQVPTAPRYSLLSVPDEGTTLDEQKAVKIRDVAQCLIRESPQALSLELEYSLYQWWSGADGSIPNEEIQALLHTGGQSFNIVVDNNKHPNFTSRMEIIIDEHVKLADIGLDGRVNYGRDDTTSLVFDELDYDGDGKEHLGVEFRESFQKTYGAAIEKLDAWCNLRTATGQTTTPSPTSSIIHYPLVSTADTGDRPANPYNADKVRRLAEYVLHQWLPLSDKDFRYYHHLRDNTRGQQDTSVYFEENNLLVAITVYNYRNGNNMNGNNTDALTIRVIDRWTDSTAKFSDRGLDGYCDFGYEQQKRLQKSPEKLFDRKRGKGTEHQDYFQTLYEHALDRLLQYYEKKVE